MRCFSQLGAGRRERQNPEREEQAWARWLGSKAALAVSRTFKYVIALARQGPRHVDKRKP